MNMVAISTLSPHHRSVLTGVHQHWPLRCIFQPVWCERSSTSPHSRCVKLIRNPWATLTRRCRKMLEGVRDARRDRAVLKALGEFSSSVEAAVDVRRLPHNQVNNDETATLIRQYQPDVIVTSGSPILKPNIFSIPRLATINVHWGLAPAYRGENTLFWPLYFGDYENIGVTIHQIDKGIDTGPVFAHGWPALSPADDELTLFAKSAQIAAELLSDVLARLSRNQSIGGRVAKGHGRLFLERDRTLVHNAAYWSKRKMGRLKLPRTSARKVIYVEETPTNGCQIQDKVSQELGG